MEAARLLDTFVKALRDEAAAQRAYGGSRIDVENGRLLDDALDGGTYCFDLHADVFLPDGVPVQLVVEKCRYDAEILHLEGDRLYLFVVWTLQGSRPPRTVSHAQILAEPWFLHEQLALRLEALTGGGDTLRIAAPLLEMIAPRLLGHGRNDAPTPGAPRSGAGAAGFLRRQSGRSTIDGPNPFQREAVDACLREPLWFVWGPPGTGKTATLGILVSELWARDQSVLVTAHANVAVDAAVLALLRELDSPQSAVEFERETTPTVVRVGPAALPEVRGRKISSRDWALRRRPDLAGQLRRLESELADLDAGEKRKKPGRSQEVAKELKEVRAKLREEERSVVAEAPLLFATLPKVAIESAIYERVFDAVVVDEASMAYPAQVVFAASLAKGRLSVFGDFRQLPPIVVSQDQQTRAVLGRDVFELAGIVEAVDRASEPEGLSMLCIQYRMHPRIREVVSNFAYLGLLQDGPTVLQQTSPIADLPPGSGSAIVLVESTALGARGWRDREWRSRWSPLSAFWSFRFAHGLASSDVKVALLTPYRAQARLLSALVRGFEVRERITAGTVHRFQGGERQAVVLDLVDAPPHQVPGLLLEGEIGQRLMTVAASRAQGKLVVLASVDLLRRPGATRDMLGSRPPAAWVPDGSHWTVESNSGSVMSCFHDLDEGFDLLERDISAAKVWRVRIPSKIREWLRGRLYETGDAGSAPCGQALLLAELLKSKSPSLSSQIEKSGSAPRGQALLVTEGLVWAFGERKDGSWSAIRVKDARVAGAIWQVLEGSRLPGQLFCLEKPADPTMGLPTCERCKGPMGLDEDVRGIIARCMQCFWVRPASPEDATRWARAYGYACPICGSPLVGRRGPSELFLGCTRYPGCDGSVRLLDVL